MFSSVLFVCLFFCRAWDRKTWIPTHVTKNQKHLNNDYAQNVPPFLSYLNQGSKFCSSRRSSRLRPVGVDIRSLSQMEANCEKKENIFKRRFWNKQLTHSQNNSRKRTARCKISRMLRTSANAFCPRTL